MSTKTYATRTDLVQAINRIAGALVPSASEDELLDAIMNAQDLARMPASKPKSEKPHPWTVGEEHFERGEADPFAGDVRKRQPQGEYRRFVVHFADGVTIRGGTYFLTKHGEPDTDSVARYARGIRIQRECERLRIPYRWVRVGNSWRKTRCASIPDVVGVYPAQMFESLQMAAE